MAAPAGSGLWPRRPRAQNSSGPLKRSPKYDKSLCRPLSLSTSCSLCLRVNRLSHLPQRGAGAAKELALGGEGEKGLGLGEGRPERRELRRVLRRASVRAEVVQHHQEVRLVPNPVDAAMLEL